MDKSISTERNYIKNGLGMSRKNQTSNMTPFSPKRERKSIPSIHCPGAIGSQGSSLPDR
jgi:hypothetical protein